MDDLLERIGKCILMLFLAPILILVLLLVIVVIAITPFIVLIWPEVVSFND